MIYRTPQDPEPKFEPVARPPNLGSVGLFYPLFAVASFEVVFYLAARLDETRFAPYALIVPFVPLPFVVVWSVYRVVQLRRARAKVLAAID